MAPDNSEILKKLKFIIVFVWQRYCGITEGRFSLCENQLQNLGLIMFIREKSKKANGGKRYLQHQLIEYVCTPSGPRQHIVLNLGQLSLPEEKWKEVTNCREGLLAYHMLAGILKKLRTAGIHHMKHTPPGRKYIKSPIKTQRCSAEK